jgi:hypothetical protein
MAVPAPESRPQTAGLHSAAGSPIIKGPFPRGSPLAHKANEKVQEYQPAASSQAAARDVAAAGAFVRPVPFPAQLLPGVQEGGGSHSRCARADSKLSICALRGTVPDLRARVGGERRRASSHNGPRRPWPRSSRRQLRQEFSGRRRLPQPLCARGQQTQYLCSAGDCPRRACKGRRREAARAHPFWPPPAVAAFQPAAAATGVFSKAAPPSAAVRADIILGICAPPGGSSRLACKRRRREAARAQPFWPLRLFLTCAAGYLCSRCFRQLTADKIAMSCKMPARGGARAAIMGPAGRGRVPAGGSSDRSSGFRVLGLGL